MGSFNPASRRLARKRRLVCPLVSGPAMPTEAEYLGREDFWRCCNKMALSDPESAVCSNHAPGAPLDVRSSLYTETTRTSLSIHA